MDPPEHGRLRTLVSRAFTPRRIDGLEPHIRDLCAQLLDPHVGGGGFDFVQDFGAQLPSMVISELLGVPDDQREAVRHAIDDTFHIEPGVGMINDVSLEARIRLCEHLEAIIADRRAHPRDDMITDLVQAEMADEDGSTRRLDRRGVRQLRQPPGQRRHGDRGPPPGLGRDDPGSPSGPAGRARRRRRAAAQRGRRAAPLRGPVTGPGSVDHDRDRVPRPTIPKDSKVLLLTGSAGRDERKYPDGERFDIHRAIDTHVSFGYGIHFCIGAALARMEGRIALEEVLARFPEWQVDHDNATRLHTSTVRGWINVPVRV